MVVPAPLQITAVNTAESSENKIHSDAIAARYGFAGALVSGVSVYGYMTQPLVRAYGSEWLERGIIEVKFFKPAYHGDTLTVRSNSEEPAAGERHCVTSATNANGDLLARLESWNPESLPPVAASSLQAGGPALTLRPEVHWDLIKLQQPAPEFLWQPGVSDNQTRVAEQRDSAACYQGSNAYLHPYYLLDACNKALMRLFVLPAWIHTNSRLVVREGLRAGQSITLRTMPQQKFERRGHQFITLDIAMLVEGRVALEVAHTAIFRIAQPDA